MDEEMRETILKTSRKLNEEGLRVLLVAIKQYDERPLNYSVADENNMLLGFISGEINERKNKVYNREGYVIGWFVKDGSQNHGVGKKLFDALREEFTNADCTHIGLDTNIENTHAIQIYEHMGFTKKLVTFFKPLKDL